MTIFSHIKPGTIIDSGSARTSMPGYLPCLAQAVSRTAYPDLYAEIGIIYGSGDGTSTFNMPLQDGNARRGVSRTPGAGSGLPNITGSGATATPNATFASHGLTTLNKIYRVRCVTAGGGLSAATDYWATVVDGNTLKFSTTLQNATSGPLNLLSGGNEINATYVALSGTNTAVLQLYPDQDFDARKAAVAGGNNSGVGSYQDDQVQAHQHGLTSNNNTAGGGGGGSPYGAGGVPVYNNLMTAVGGNETRMRNMATNWWIKT